MNAEFLANIFHFCGELLKEGSKGTDVNEGRFVLNIDVLFVYNGFEADRCVYF
jgi:hypothetical protein